MTSFALAVYGREGMPAVCLALQDDLGLNVNVVLFAAFVGAVRGEVLTEADLEAAGARVGGWHSDVVVALRMVRRRLKGYPGTVVESVEEAVRSQITNALLVVALSNFASRWRGIDCSGPRLTIASKSIVTLILTVNSTF